jgi:hypothetical protein
VIDLATLKSIVKLSVKTVAFAPHVAEFWPNGGVMR